MLIFAALTLAPWSSHGDLRTDPEVPERPAAVHREPAWHLWQDLDGDGRLDLIAGGRSGLRFLRNAGDGGFEDVSLAAAVGAPGTQAASGAACADFDGDGRPDLFLAGPAGASRLLLNRGEWQFEDRTPELGPVVLGEVASARVLDDDGDGDADLYVDLRDESGAGGFLLRNRGAHGESWAAFDWLELPAATPAESTAERGDGRADGGGDGAESPGSVGSGLAGGSAARGAVQGAAGSAGLVSGSASDSIVGPGTGGTGGAAAGGGVASGADPADGRLFAGLCAPGIEDQSSGACLGAASTPTLGALYPLGPEFFIDPGGHVGIGTLAPQSRLEVVGIGTGVDALRVRQGDLRLEANSRLVLDDGSQFPREAFGALGSELLVGNDSWDAVHMGPAASLTLDGSGRVGVNQQVPQAALDVRGSGLDALRVEQGRLHVGATSSVALEDSSQSSLDALASFGGDELLIGNDSWNAIHVGPAASLTVSSTGRVGVNQQAPQASLDVRGNGLDAMSVDQGRLRVGASSSIALDDSSQSSLDALASYGGDELLLGNDSWNAVHVGPAASLTVSSTGRVGVNQQAPQASLDVRGNGLDALRVEQGRFTVSSSSSVALESPGQGTLDALASYGGDELLIGNDSWDAVQVGPASSLTVDSTGRVGVNQSNPQATLDVRGNGLDAIRVEQGRLNLASSSGLTFEDPGQGAREALASNGGDELYLGNDNWNEVHVGQGNGLTVNAGGRVGVNTHDPHAPLHVQGDGSEAIRVEQGSLQIGTSSSLAFETFSQSLVDAMASYGGEDLYIGAGGWNAIWLGQQGSLMMDSSGRIGINEASPQAALDVRGNGQEAVRIRQGDLAIGSASTVRLEDAGGGSRDALASYGGDDLFVGDDAWNAVHVGPFGSMTVSSTGNVGIGDTSPDNVLTVPQGTPTDPIADAWTTYSSRRWKKDVETFEGALETVGKLRGVRYRWKETDAPDVGFIAEEVGAVLPELVQFEDNGVDARSVDYARMTAVLLQAVNEQQAMIEDLRRAVDALEAERDSLAAGR